MTETSSTSHVSIWLESLPLAPDVPDAPDAALRARRKRRRLLTPPDSRMAHSPPQPPPKRTRHDRPGTSSASSDDRSIDVDATPKVTLPQRILVAESQSQTSESSVGSRSPTKRKRKTAMAAGHSIRQLDLDASDVPTSLRDMLLHIRKFSKGIGVIAASEKDTIESVRDAHLGMSEIEHGLYFSDGSRDKLGPTPTTAQVIEIVRRGKMCHDHSFDEGAWNTSLHHRVIALAVPELWEGPGKAVYMVPCTSASILPDLVQSGPTRKVDFALCIEPTTAASAIIDELIPHQFPSINHTDYGVLKTHPIGLVIETKLQGEGLSTAQAQLLSWHANQWSMLDRLTSGTLPRIALPDFLPGIIIQGHDWLFVASTRVGDAVILWSSQRFGATSECLGVYQIVCVLQYLVGWIKTTYWRWFQRAILCIEP